MQKKKLLGTVFGFIAMGLVLLIIPMFFLPTITSHDEYGIELPDDSEKQSINLIDVNNVRSELNDLVKEYKELGMGDLEPEEKALVNNINMIVISAIIAIVLSVIAAVFNALPKKMLKLIGMIFTALVLVAVIMNMVSCGSLVSFFKDEEDITVSIGVGVWLALALSVCSLTMSVLGFVFYPGGAKSGRKMAMDGGVDLGGNVFYDDYSGSQVGGYAVQPSVAKGTITFLSGSNAGYSIPIPAGEEIVIGKDPSVCSVVIDKKYDRVSRKHCGVRYDPSQNLYLVTDYSSNGTRLVGGAKLAHNSTSYLESGSVISLAKTENNFRLG